MRRDESLRWLLLLAVAFAATSANASLRVPEGAYGSDVIREGRPAIEARLLVHPDDVATEDTLRIGVLFDLAPGWHLYWRNPGETGLAPDLRFEVEGGVPGPVAWPAPAVFEEADGEITAYGYEGRVLLASEVELILDVAEQRSIRLDADVLICEHECIPATFSLERGLAVRADATELREVFAQAARAVPVAAESLGVGVDASYSQSAMRPGDAFAAALEVSPCGGGAADCEAWRPPPQGPFFPDALPGAALEVSGVRPHPEDPHGWVVALAGRIEEYAGPEEATALRGVLALQSGDGALRHVEVELPLPRAQAGAEVAQLPTPWLGSAAAPSAAAATPTLLHALWLALLGGLLLNLMPCVLPVLALKVFSVTQLASHSRREARRHGLAYGAGVLLTMLALASVVLALRAAGSSVGWGFQFQEPLFVAAISTVLVVFALNLFGVFEIGMGAGALASLGDQATGARRSFFEGLLAVVLATPCTAPFLGTAVGFAFAASPLVIVSIFAAIGVGLASPFALVAFVPGWARLIPKPGSWMLALRAGLGFALLATVVWLAWVFGRTAGADGLAALLAFLLVVAFATWVYGLLQRSRPAWLPYATAIGIVAIVAGGVGAVRLEPGEPAPSLAAEGWEPYRPDAVAAELASGRRVLVTFTADWCITCKVNERVVLADDRVLGALASLDVARFRADWTRRDESIRAELARFGKAGVPLYLVYHPEDPEQPILLPELLSVDVVLEALRTAPSAQG